MWRVVRRRLGRMPPPPPDDASDSGNDFEDMMDIYDEGVDEALRRFQPGSRSPGADVETSFVSNPNARPDFGRAVRSQSRFDSNVEEDGEMSPMLGEASAIPQRFDSLPYADDSPKSSARSEATAHRSVVRLGPRAAPPPMSSGYISPPPSPENPPPDSPEILMPPVTFTGGILNQTRQPQFPVYESIERTYRPGAGASPQLFDQPGTCQGDERNISPKREPHKFFKYLIKAIKTDNKAAVESMCRSASSLNVDLSDTTLFTEKRYTATGLHVALLFKRAIIAEILITHCPKLVDVAYTSKYLKGQTVFHIAAANGDIRTLNLMLNQKRHIVGAEAVREALDGQATGTYFLKHHQEGSLCLTAAIWAGNVEMLEVLLMNNASMNREGPCGNTPLHHLVFFSDEYPDKQAQVQDMFLLFWQYCDQWLAIHSGGFTAVEDCEQKARSNKVRAMRDLLQIRNADLQTPLTLAVNLQAPIAKYLLNFEPVYRLPQTKYGSTSWVTYDVTDVTSYGTDRHSWTRYNPSSVLHILAHRAKIVSSDDKNFEDLIQTQPVIDLVKMKWKVYRWVYYLWALFHFLYMSTLTWYSTHYQFVTPSTDNDTLVSNNYGGMTNTSTNLTMDVEQTVSNSAKSCVPWIFLALPLVYIIAEAEDIVFVSYRSWRSLTTSRGFVKTFDFLAEQWTVTGNGPFRVTLICFSICMLAWATMFEMENVDQDLPLAFALGLGWIYMLFFTRGFKATSRFSIMVQKMFFQDFIYFLSVYCFIWIAFASAMQALVRKDERGQIGIGETLYNMLNIVTDAGEKATEEPSRLPKIAAMILSCYAVISVILLLNMLIAMMNASYDAVKMSKTNLFRYQQLSILLMIERRLFWWRWLCVRSQKHLWSPKTPLKDFVDGKQTLRMGTDEVKMGATIPKRLTPKRMYVEVTERTFSEDDSIYKPYLTR